ncbi:MAG TPA: hypothetical protein VHV09_13970, partial [Trebonia sp.]|nr:hypothetical protein [Trebonia sp.]
MHTEPVGVCVFPLPAEGIAPRELAALLWRQLSEPVSERFAAAGRPRPAELTEAGLTEAGLT